MALGSISELIDRIEVKEPQELQFRVKIKKLQNVKIKQDTKAIEKQINSILVDIEKLRVNKSLTAVNNHIELLDKASDGMYWANLDFTETNEITDVLAPLMKYKTKNEIVVGHFDLEDSIDTSKIKKVKPVNPSVDLKAYEAHILEVIQKLVIDSSALQQLFVFGTLSDTQIEKLKNELLKENIEIEQLSEMFECKSNDLIEIFNKIINKKEYKLPYLLDDFLKTHSLSSSQIDFIKAIKHYVQEKHDIHRKDLMTNPFTKFHKMGIMGMFQGSLMNELVEIIDDRREA